MPRHHQALAAWYFNFEATSAGYERTPLTEAGAVKALVT